MILMYSKAYFYFRYKLIIFSWLLWGYQVDFDKYAKTLDFLVSLILLFLFNLKLRLIIYILIIFYSINPIIIFA